MNNKYPRGKIVFHPSVLLENLKKLEDESWKVSVNFKELNLKDTLNELKEMVSRFIPQKPNGDWGPSYLSCPRCPCCGQRVRSGSTKYSPIQDTKCRKCGQLIDWSAIKKYNKNEESC